MANRSESPALQEQFETLEQQKTADRFGMWIFLATEIMFFGGMFTGYAVYRIMYPVAFGLASAKTSFPLGTGMTFILITSSLTLSLGVRCARLGNQRGLLIFLGVTMFLASLFLGLKFYEWYLHYRDHLIPGYDFVFDPRYYRAAALFFCFYFVMTGVHGLHLLIGLFLLVWLLVYLLRNPVRPEHPAHVEMLGLYYHFVDIIWIFLYPLLYLINRHI